MSLTIRELQRGDTQMIAMHLMRWAGLANTLN